MLTRRMAAGEDAAFAEFHAAYFPRLLRYVLVLMRGDEHAARDVVQETLLRVVRNSRVFSEETSFWGWLSCLARSAAADHGRRASRYRRLLEVFRLGRTADATEPAAEELQAAVTRALTVLPPGDASLLRRKYHEGASVRELAASLGRSEEAVESRLSRARRALRDATFHILKHEKS